MKVKELIEKLNKCDKEKEVVIRFAVVDDDEIGYVLFPKIVDEYYDQIALYSDYPHNKEGCDFIGQVDLATAYRNERPDITGDEMLENLGYKKTEVNKKYLRYYKGSRIDFDLECKEIKCIATTKQGITHFRYFTMDELKAIHQICKEQGWI